MQTFDFTPFYRSTVGFDRLFSRLDNLVGQEAKTYPPYNIEKIGEDNWRVSVAVAGFAPSDIAIESKENSLTIKGAKAPEAAGDKREFLHRGIAERAFELRFQLADHVEVSGASLNNGLLDIDLKLELPRARSPARFRSTAARRRSRTSRSIKPPGTFRSRRPATADRSGQATQKDEGPAAWLGLSLWEPPARLRYSPCSQASP